MSFSLLPDLACARLGGKVLAANDEFFAAKENLIKPGRGVFLSDKFTSRGKWMDGWETRRRRTPGFDWCLLRLGLRGIIRGLDIDTNHFIGNYPEHASLEACDAPGTPSVETLLKSAWTEIFPKSQLKGGSQNLFMIADSRPWTHVRLNIFPDGGVARLRVHGEAVPDWKLLSRKNGLIDLAALIHGGCVLSQSDMFFGRALNMIMPGKAKNMGEGWETKRRRGPGHDWAILRLGTSGTLERVEVDTNHFKGNFPESFSLETSHGADPGSAAWEEIIPRRQLKAHSLHVFPLKADRITRFVRFNIYPDGGVSRLRLYGKPGKD